MDRKRIDELRQNVWESQIWPQRYIFKFIVPNEGGKVKKVVALLPAHAKLSYKHTESLRHVSVTAIAVMASAEEVRKVTRIVSAIEGVISL